MIGVIPYKGAYYGLKDNVIIIYIDAPFGLHPIGQAKTVKAAKRYITLWGLK